MSETITCGWCAETIPADVETCPHCQGNVAAGQIQRAEVVAQQRAAQKPKAAPAASRPPGPTIVARVKPAPLRWEDRPGGIIAGALIIGVVAGVLGGGLYYANEVAGTVFLIATIYFTSALFAIGIIAKGVELGIRAARHREDLDF